MSGSVCLVTARVCWLTFRNAYLGLLVILLLLPFNLQVIVELWLAKILLVFFWIHSSELAELVPLLSFMCAVY